jgi:peptide/nickel transport system substrate-binding protein
VALGPFKFESYDKGSVAKVRRYDGYFEKDAQGRALPFMDGIDFVIIRDAGAMVSAFRARRLDGTSRGAGFGVRPEFQETIKKDLGDKAWFSRVLYVGWGQKPNTMKPPWNDIELRRAVSLFFDREKVSILSLGGSSVPGGVWTPGSSWANKDVPSWPGMNPATKEEDRATAMKILKDNGWEGMKTEILCRDIYIYLCEGWDGQMREMGFDNALTMMDNTSMEELTSTGNFTQQFTSNTGAMPSAKVSGYCSVMCNSRSHNHDDLYVDELFDKIISTADVVERNRLTQEVERYVMQEKIYRDSWFHEVVVIAYRDRIKGLPGPQMNVHDNVDMATVWIDSSIPR